MRDIVSKFEIRGAKAGRRLGNAEQCAVCGESDKRCLELHHVAGRSNHDDVVAICRNCHRKLSDDQTDHPDGIGISPFREFGHYLLGLADFLEALLVRLREIGNYLVNYLPPQVEAASC